MAEKFWTTGNKKIAVAAGLGITGWHALTIGNPFSLPALPAFVSNPLIAGISLVTVAGAVTLYAIIMLYSDF